MGSYERHSYTAAEAQKRRRRQEFRRHILVKKIMAVAVLALIGICIIGAVAGIGFGIYKFFDSRRMVEEPYSDAKLQNIVLVDNASGDDHAQEAGEDVNASYFAELMGDNDGLSDELLTQTIDDSGEHGDAAFSGNGSDITDNGGGPEGARLIVVDAGHGGKDSGAVGTDGCEEKNINLSIALKVNVELRKRGFRVYMTRSDDTFIGLSARPAKANELGADAFVSVHMNSFNGKGTANGVESWTYKEREGCPELAQLLTDHVAAATGARNRGVSYAKNLVVTSQADMPSVIIECGYVSDPDEVVLLQQDEYQNTISCAIADAVEEFFSDKN